MHIFGWIIAVSLMLAGIVGTVLPGMPGTILVFAGLWVAARIDGFSRVGFPLLMVLGILSVLAYFLDVAAATLGAKRVHASHQAICGAAIGTTAGLFMGFFGLIVMPFLGAVAGEYLAHRDLEQAGRVGVAAWIGLALGVAARLGLAFLMIGIFFLAFFWPT